MDAKIKILILCLLSVFTLQAQTPHLNFAARFQITSATGGDPYNIVGIVSDDLSRFTGSDVAINDSIYVIDGSDVYVLAVTSITSVVGPTVTLVANDPLDAGVSIPTGQAAILRPTNNYTLPVYISGLRDDLRSMIMNRQAQLIDEITGGGLSITDFISAGVAVPPSAPANLNGGETWRNGTTGELWASDGVKWYPFNYGPKECVDTVTVSLITVQSGGSVTTGSPLVRNSSGVWEHLYNHATPNLIPDGVVTDVITGPRAIIQYCGVRKGSGATPNTSYYVDQTANTGFTTTKPTTNIRPLGKVASNGDFLINAGLLFSRDNANANNGVSSDGTNIQLGNVLGTTTAQLTSQRYIPTNNNSLKIGSNDGRVFAQFSGDSTDNNAILKFKFRDTTISNSKIFMQAQPIRHGSQVTPIYFGMNSQVQTSNDPNSVFSFGFNMNPNGAKFEAGKPIVGESWESNYRPSAPTVYPRWIEKHEIYMPSYSNTQRRLSSYVITESGTSANYIDFFHTVDHFRLRDTTLLDYFTVQGIMNGTRRSVVSLLAGPSTSLNITLDSTQNTLVWGNTSTAPRKATSIFSIDGYRQYVMTNYTGRNFFSHIAQPTYNQNFFGNLAQSSETYFYTNNIEGGFGTYFTSTANTSTNLTARGHISVGAGSTTAFFGARSDINMAYIGTSSAFAIRSNALQVGPTAGTTLPLGVTLQVNSNAANTVALQKWQTTTDSAKLFLTNATPNSLITGRVGDVAFGTDGGFYFKKTGANTNTGWIDLAGLSENSWQLTGNSIIAGTQFLGSTNNVSLRFRTNNLQRAMIDSTGNVGIANIAPTEKLDVTGNIRFSGALMPNNTAGTSGQVLTSAGAGVVPTWTTNTSESTSIGSFNNTGNSNGLSLSGSALSSALYMRFADDTANSWTWTSTTMPTTQRNNRGTSSANKGFFRTSIRNKFKYR